jgi:endoglucanase
VRRSTWTSAFPLCGQRAELVTRRRSATYAFRMHSRSSLVAVLVAALMLILPAAAFARPGDRPAAAPRALPPGPPTNLHTRVVPGQKAIEVTWDAPTGQPPPLGYEVLVDGVVVGGDPVPITDTSFTITDGLELGHTYDIAVRGTLLLKHGDEASREQILYLAPVTTVQPANPTNPLAGVEWGVYTGSQDPAINGWKVLSQANRDQLAPIAMIHKTKFFGRWIKDGDVEQKTREYIADAQAGDKSRLTLMTLFRMDPWEGSARIDKRLPDKADRASYKRYVTGMARAIGSNKVAVVVQPDGYFARIAYQAWVKKVGRHKALLPTRMLAWTSKTLAALPNTEVYVDMGSEDWARGNVGEVAKYLRLCGVEFARGFSLNVSHKNYLDREVLFAKKVSQALAQMGPQYAGKHAVIDTSDNGHPFAGKELNPAGNQEDDYTAPGSIDPCTTANQKGFCTALGVPPTTDVDNDAWHLPATADKAAARYVDAYLWVSRPWLPDQGAGATPLSPQFAASLLKTWQYTPYFTP